VSFFYLALQVNAYLHDMTTALTNRQNQILESTVKIIHEKGIQGFTIKNLSHSIGITEAAIYRHFTSKHDILCAVLDRFILSLSRFTEMISESEMNSIEKIENIYNQLSDIFTKNPAYVSVIFAEEIFKNNKMLSSKVGKILEINNHVFMTIIDEGQKNNEIIQTVNSQELTLMVMGAYRLMVKHWKMDNFSFDLRMNSDRLMTSMKIIITNKN